MKERTTVLVVDGGGRGSALVDAYAKSPHVNRVLTVPGNDLMGINTHKEVKTFQHLKTTDRNAIARIAKRQKVDLVDVAQDNAIEKGVVDAIEALGIPVVGPTEAAGIIEYDKEWARRFGLKYGLNQPAFEAFTGKNHYQNGIKHLEQLMGISDHSWFVKAAGLAEGKAALFAEDNKDAIKQIRELEQRFPHASKKFLLEVPIIGEEFSTFAICDGETFRIVGSAQDHKRAYDGDEGPNTGGIGCSAPPLVLTDEIMKGVSDIFTKTIAGMKEEGKPYKGVLYLGGMISEQSDKPFVIEFNARWGDPEAEVLIPGLVGDFFEIGIAIAEGRIDSIHIGHDGKARVAIAGAAKGYPTDWSRTRGKEIFGLDEVRQMEGVRLYSAGVEQKKNGRHYVNGGRLFYIVAEGETTIDAVARGYDATSVVHIEDDGLHFRTDIGWRDVERLQK